MDRLFKKILIATDGSSCSKKAVIYGIELAKHLNTRLLALYVLDSSKSPDIDQCVSPGMPKETLQRILRQSGEDALKYVESLAKREGLQTEGMIVEGHPAEEIIKVANEQSADLIVMGALGVTGIKKYLIGSVAEKVVRHSNVPVLTVRMG
jgi:nucleotide-binding universal stress UspA family protein